MKNECRKGIRKTAFIVAVLLILMSLLAACSTEESRAKNYYNLDVVDHTSDFYVNDFAGVFSETQKSELMANAVGFDEEYSGIQVVITTVESLDFAVQGYEYVVEDADGNRVDNSEIKQPNTTPEFTIEQVAYSMYSEYGIGLDDMGILILFSTGDREVRIETGRQMQIYITDTISGKLLDDYGMDYFVEDKFAEGLISVQAAVIDEIKSKVDSNWHTSSESESFEDSKVPEIVEEGTVTQKGDANSATSDKSEKKDSGNGILWGFFGSIAAAFAAVVAFIRQKFKGKKEKEKLEKAKQEEVDSLKSNFQSELAEREEMHEANISDLRRDYQKIINEKDSQIRDLNGDLSNANGQIRTLKTQFEDMTELFNRAQRLHPEYNFKEEVHEMIESEYKAEAKGVDLKIAEVLAIPADKDNYDVFNRALSLIDGTIPEVRKYITSDRAKVKALYDEAVCLKQEFERAEQEKRDKAAAQKAYDEINHIFSKNPQGNHKNYDVLHAALAVFLELSVAQKAFFPDNGLINRLKDAHNSAERDYKDYKAAKNAESEVESVVGYMSSADEDDRDKLERAMRYYRNLNSAQQVYFSEELLRKLKRLISDAEDDHRNQERRRADERRRAEQMRRNSSSFSSTHRSSFGGHGGRPSGGGASRRF